MWTDTVAAARCSLSVMLRRPPTAITLTSADIAQYEEAKKARDAAAAGGQASRANENPADRAKMPPVMGIDARTRQKLREERMGLEGLS